MNNLSSVINAIKEEFNKAGLGELNECWVDSVLVGSSVHQYFTKGNFGEGA